MVRIDKIREGRSTFFLVGAPCVVLSYPSLVRYTCVPMQSVRIEMSSACPSSPNLCLFLWIPLLPVHRHGTSFRRW